MEDNNGNFLDKNTLLAIGLSILFFIGWQFYVQKKYPQTKTKKQSAVLTTQKESLDQKKESQTSPEKAVKSLDNSIDRLQQQAPEQVVLTQVETKNLSAQLSSQGMGLTLVELNQYSDRSNKKIRFTNNDLNIGNFATSIAGQTPSFKITQESENIFVGTAQISQGTLIKRMVFDDDTYTVDVSLKLLSGKMGARDAVDIILSNQALKVKSSMFAPAYEGTEVFAINDGSEERERIDIDSQLSQSYGKTTLVAIGTQYFAVALKDKNDIIPSSLFEYQPKEQVVFAKITYAPQVLDQPSGIQFTGFIGPKKYDVLKKIGPDFVQMIDYGIFSILSKPILTLLKWLYALFNNWGLAIILLTVFIRVLLLPINISSLRSMKKMQKIQPQLKAIKEKYKEDPVRVNQETMALMKKEKANPLGGCLPMLLQLPVFFALYSVLGQSVELYKAPFILWIQDLSFQDPYYVLPIAVGALYFLQMNITPQTGMDPTQAKVMKFIPILFCFFMITVPSGLTLYFFVNTVFGIGQQFIFQREKRKAAA